jgi:hypothetical protein
VVTVLDVNSEVEEVITIDYGSPKKRSDSDAGIRPLNSHNSFFRILEEPPTPPPTYFSLYK